VYSKYISDDLRKDETLKKLSENKVWEQIKSPFIYAKKEKPKAFNPYVKLDTDVVCEP
jgi:hypothetical protein